MSGDEMSLAIILSVAIICYAAVKITRILTNNWENEA